MTNLFFAPRQYTVPFSVAMIRHPSATAGEPMIAPSPVV